VLLIARAGSGADVIVDGRTQVFFALTGLVTALPLLAFATAAKHLSLSTLGLLQYVAPTLQFILGVVVYDEEFNRSMLVGYAIIWVGLVFFAADSVRATRGSVADRPPATLRLPSRP
jgi:chloramphenicol-sensitive protein RarD